MAEFLTGTVLSDDQRENLKVIGTSADDLPTILNGILALSKTEAGIVTLEAEGFAVRTLVEGVAGQLASIAHTKGLGLFTQVAPDLPSVCRGDPIRLRQPLLNLVGNAASVPGRESTFWFSVPLAVVNPALPVVTVDENGDHTIRPPTILVVEDDLVNQKVALRQLQKLGYAVTVAANGREGVEAALRGCYALILMDCQMPEMDGYEATRMIRAAERDAGRYTPIVAMTANTMEGNREACLAAGMDDYLVKPVHIDKLCRVLEGWGANRGAAMQPDPVQETGKTADSA